MCSLPTGWTTVTIGQLCNLINGRAFKSSEWVDKGLPIIRIQNLNNSHATFNYYNGDIDQRHVVQKGQVLFAWSGTPGTSFGAHVWSGPKAVLNQHIFKVEFSEEYVDKSFLVLAINQKLNELIDKAHGGVGLRHVTKGKFEGTILPLPPLNEQRRIVAKLDSLIARSRRAREELARVPRLVERYKQAVLEHALNGDWIPVFEKTIWRKACIASVVESLFDGPFGSNLKSSDYVAQGKRVVRLENVANLRFVVEKETYISQEKFDALKRHMLLSGDVIISSFIDDSIRVCLLPESLGGKAINKADCFCVRTNSSICLPEFLAYKMASSSAYKLLVRSVHGATRPRINLKALKEFCFLLPTIREQEIIIKQVSEKFAAIDKMASEVSRSYCILDHLDQATLVKAFRGDLVPQDPNDEPASALLERLKSEASEAPKPRRGRKPKKSIEAA